MSEVKTDNLNLMPTQFENLFLCYLLMNFLLKSLPHSNNCRLFHWLSQCSYTLLARLLTMLSHTVNMFTDCPPDVALPVPLCIQLYLVTCFPSVNCMNYQFYVLPLKVHKTRRCLTVPPCHEVHMWDPVLEVHIIIIDSGIDCQCLGMWTKREYYATVHVVGGLYPYILLHTLSSQMYGILIMNIDWIQHI